LPTRTTTAYRWDRVKKLAKNLDPLGVAKNYVDRDGTGAPDNNADSIAYFGLGAYFQAHLFKVERYLT
jgi:hypothetical protein